jgi:predicted nuclease of predicted toxin-antitoxin system
VRLLLDENVAPAVVPRLTAEGFDAIRSVVACGFGASDDQVLARAVADERAIVTHDRDFGLLATRRREFGLAPCSVVLLRPGAASLDEVIHALRETRALAEGHAVGWFAVASLRDGHATIRFRSR